MSEINEITTALANFCHVLKTEILEYYNRCYSYVKDLYAEKSIDVTFKIAYESEKDIKDTVEAMIKTTNLALNTIGVSKKRMMRDSKVTKEIVLKKGEEYSTYNAYFERDLKPIINNCLFEILVEYLIDWDTSKIENLDLFDLLPRKFLDRLDIFKDEHINSTHLKRVISQQLELLTNFVDMTALKVRGEEVQIARKPLIKELKEEAPSPAPIEKEEEEEEDILKQLEEVKMMNIEALKASILKSADDIKPKPEPTKITPIKTTPPALKTTLKAERSVEVKISDLKPSPSMTPEVSVKESLVEPIIEKTTPPPVMPPTQEILTESIEPPKIPPPAMKSVEVAKPPSVKLPKKEALAPETFIDYFGKFPPLNPTIINQFNINKSNLLNSRISNPEYFDLECLYYYIAILKMLNLQNPFSDEEIIEITKKYINNKVFSSGNEVPPDPLSIFYGLAIYSEADLIRKNNIIDLLDIEMFLESEVKQFIPQKMHLNLFTLLSFKILEKNGAIVTDKSILLSSILSIDLTSLEEFDPILDVYEQLVFLKLLDKNVNLTHFKAIYIQNIKALMAQDDSVNQTITDSARALLILDLLGLKKQEFNLCQKILNYVVKATRFFNLDFNREFNWQNEPLGFKIELRMMFWALLASSQYQAII